MHAAAAQTHTHTHTHTELLLLVTMAEKTKLIKRDYTLLELMLTMLVISASLNVRAETRAICRKVHFLMKRLYGLWVLHRVYDVTGLCVVCSRYEQQAV